MSTVSVTTNARLLAHVLGDVRGDQIPWATAKALTELAFTAQRAERSELARSMHLRNRFSQSGLQVNRAEKADWPATYAEIGIEERRSYLIDHVTGGKRQGGTHGRAILEDESLRSSGGRVPAGKRPAALIARAKRAQHQGRLNAAFGGKGRDKRLPFLFYSAKWGNEVLAQRTGDDRYPLRIIYAFRKGVSIKPEFHMHETAQRVVGLHYAQAFNQALRRAIAGAKDKAERGASRSRGVEIEDGR